MKRLLILALLSLILTSCQNKEERVYLTDWQFNYNGQWYKASVPGFIHTDLMANGLIPDPYYGTNEDSVQWVADYPFWTYSTDISSLSLPKGDTLWLVCEGLAGNCRIYLCHGKYSHVENEQNMFVQKIMKLPDSCYRIEIDFFPLDDDSKQKEYVATLPDKRAFTRIAPYQQGWDWGPKLTTCGIWKEVYITNRKPSITSTASITRDSRVELRQEQDSIGQSFTFYRDGKPIFIKGANWIPAHSFPVMTPELAARYRMLLCSAKEANFNMIRVWGGGIYEHDYFYDLCDSLGLMVWHDFNFSTMLYPDDPYMLASIHEEAIQNVARIAKHPCVVLWCGNNEVKNGWEDWGWQGVYNWTPEQRARLEHGMDTIFGYTSETSNTSSTSILAQAVAAYDPLHRPYITTSPLYGWGHPECTTHGDSHYWGVWWGEEPFEMYKEKTGRFMSEYGFQSYPLMSTIRRYCPEAQLSIDSPAMRNHQKHPRGLQIIDKAMRQYYGFDSKNLSLEDYVYVSQLLQAWGTGYGVLCHLTNPRCDGTLYWQLNDCWPVASWSSIDYYGNWKALHYRVQKLFDNNADLAGWEKYYSIYPKDRKYEKAKYKTTHNSNDGHLSVSIKAENDIYDVYIDTYPHIDGHFTSNFVDLKAGESITTTLIPIDKKTDVSKVRVIVKTLNDIYTR
ncbi:MAG: hypothetical protein J6Y98_03335 [Bacteroidales bacterium]|nr:hypothetical protein [Bacteroidales bacterium]